MSKQKKLWSSMQAASIAGLVTIAGCSTDGEDLGEDTEAKLDEHLTHSADSLGEGEGEGEGGNGSIDLATNDLAYLKQLALVRGHLFVGHELFQAGHIKHAKTHMKHPEAELYADIVPAFSARGAAGFAEPLSALANAVEGNEEKAVVANRFDELQSAIAKNESFVGEEMASTKARLQLAVGLLRTAAEEYAIAVVDGKMQNAHEYQDALGFTKVASDVVEASISQNEKETAAIASTKVIFSELEPLWPSLVPPETLDTEAAKLYAAASRVEILALGL